MHLHKIVSVLFLAIIVGGYAAPLTFTTVITGESPVAKENLLPRSKVSAETDNIDSFDVHPTNRWKSSESAGITSSIERGNLKVDAPEDNDFRIERQIFEADGEVDYRYGVDYTNDSATQTFSAPFDDFDNEHFEDNDTDINDWEEGDLEGWLSNDTLSLFGDHYLKILNDDGSYYYTNFEELFEGHLPDPRSTPAQPILLPNASYDDDGTFYAQTFTIPEGQEWLLSYLAFNLGQYDGVFPCVNIGWCIDNDSSLYDYETGETYSSNSPINAQTQTAGQLFTVPQGQVWNITNIGGWFYYFSPYGLDFFAYDSEFSDSLNFSEWDLESLETLTYQRTPNQIRYGDDGTTRGYQWNIKGTAASDHISQIFEVPTGEEWIINALGFDEISSGSDSEGIIGITAVIDGQARNQSSPYPFIDTKIPDFSTILTSTITADETPQYSSFGYASWSVPTVILTEGFYALFLNSTDSAATYGYFIRGNNKNNSESLDFFSSNALGSMDLWVEWNPFLWDIGTQINYTLQIPFSSNLEFFTDVQTDTANFFEDNEGFTAESGTSVAQLNDCFGFSGCLNTTDTSSDGEITFRTPTGLGINSTLYTYFGFRFYGNGTGTINEIDLKNDDLNSVIFDQPPSGWTADEWHSVFYNFNATSCDYFLCDFDQWTGTINWMEYSFQFDNADASIMIDYVYLQNEASWNELLLDRYITAPDGESGGFGELYLPERRYENVYAREDNASLTTSASAAGICDTGVSCWDHTSQMFIVPDGETWYVDQVGYENITYYGTPTGLIGITGWKIETLGGGGGDDYVPDFTDIKGSVVTGTPTGNNTAVYWDLSSTVTLTSGIYFWFWNGTSSKDAGNYYDPYLDTVDASSNTTYDLITLVFEASPHSFYKAALGDFFANLRMGGTIIWNPKIVWEAGSTEFWWIDANVYKNLTMRIMPVNNWDGRNERNASALDIIENATIYDYDGNQVCFTAFASVVLENGTWYEESCILSDDPDWSGNERGFSIEFGLQVGFDNVTETLRDGIWIDYINITGIDTVNASIGIVGLDGSGFADWTNIKGYQNLTEDDMINGMVDTTSFTSITLDSSFLISAGTYAWFLNYTSPIPSSELGEWKISIAIDIPDNPTYTDIRYLNTTGWEIVAIDYLAQFNYTKQYDDFTPRGHIGIAGVEAYNDFFRMDIDNIYWNTSIGNLQNNNSWNYFPLDETLFLSTGTYMQYIWSEADFDGCGSPCSNNTAKLFSNGYLLYSDEDSPEDSGEATDDERLAVYQYDRYLDTEATPIIRDFYWGVNYTDVYNCATDCVGEYTSAYWNHTYLNDNWNVEIDSPSLGRNSAMQTFEVPNGEIWRITHLGNEKMYRWGSVALTGIIGIVSASVGTCGECGYWDSADLNVYLPDWNNILTSQTFDGSEVSLSSDYKYWEVPTIDLTVGTYLWFVNITDDVSGTAALGFDGEQNPATNNTRDYFGWGSAAGGWLIGQDEGVNAYWDYYVAINYTLITTFYFNNIFPLIEEFSRDVYQPKLESSPTTFDTQDLNITDSFYSTFRIPEIETWYISSISVQGKSVGTPTPIEWYITTLKQCVQGTTCNDWTGITGLDGLSSAWIPDMSNILTNGTTSFTTSVVWQNITLAYDLILTNGAYAIVFIDVSTDDDGNYYDISLDRDIWDSATNINVTQTGIHNSSMSWEWYIAAADDQGTDGLDLRFQIHFNNSEINAEDYNILKIVFQSNITVSSILINDFDGNQVCLDSTGWSADIRITWSCDLSDDADWGSLEHGLQFNFTTATTSTIQLANVTLFSDYSMISITGETIAATTYNDIVLRFNNTNMIESIDFLDTAGNVVDIQYNFESGYRHELIGTLGGGWADTETELHVRFNWNITEPIITDYILLDYLLLFWTTSLRSGLFDTDIGDDLTFNDGTIESMTDYAGGSLSNYNNQYLQVEDDTDSVIKIKRTGLSFSGVVYPYIFFRFWINTTVNQIEIYDTDDASDTLVCGDATDRAANQWHNFYCDLGDDPDWDSFEDGFAIWIATVSAVPKLFHLDYVQILTNTLQYTYALETWITPTNGELEDMTDVVLIPNGTDSYIRFYLYPNNKERQILKSGSSFAAEADYHSNFFFLYITNFYVDEGNNSLQVGFLSDTTGLNWIDFNTTQFDNSNANSTYAGNLTDQWAYNDINTTVRNIMIPLWNVTGWEGNIIELYINITDTNNEQHFMLDAITIEKVTWTHNPDVIYGFWDKVYNVPLMDVKHSIMSYWDFNASFRTEITLYNSTGDIAAYYYSPLTYFDPNAIATIYYRAFWDYNLPESQVEFIFYDDGQNKLWDADFGTDFIKIDPNPKIFDTVGIVPSLYYIVNTSTDESVVAWTDFINAQFKEREWTLYDEGVNKENVTVSTPFVREVVIPDGTKTILGMDVFTTNFAKWRLSVANLDSVSGTIASMYNKSVDTCSFCDYVGLQFHVYNVNASTGDLTRIMAVGQRMGDDDPPWAYLFNSTAEFWNTTDYRGYWLPEVEGYWAGTEFSITTRDDRQYMDISLRHYGNMSEPDLHYDGYFTQNVSALTDWSQEYVLEIFYFVNKLYEMGTYSARITDFGFTSRGWVEDLAGAIFNPIFDIIGGLLRALWDIFVAIFTPLIMFLAWILSLALSAIGTIFQFAIDGLSVILDVVASVLDTIFGILGDILTELIALFGTIIDILIEFLVEILVWIEETVLPWIVTQMLLIWGTLAEGVFNIIDPSGGISDFFAGLFANDATDLFSALFGVIDLVGSLVTLIWIGLTFYIFTSPAFQAEGDANRYASEFMGNAFTFHGVYLSIMGFNIPIFLPTFLWWLMLTVLLGYLDWVMGGIVLW